MKRPRDRSRLVIAAGVLLAATAGISHAPDDAGRGHDPALSGRTGQAATADGGAPPQLAFDEGEPVPVGDGTAVVPPGEIDAEGGFTTEAGNDGEIRIDVPVPDASEGRDGAASISAEAAVACAGIEQAIESNRVGDTAAVERVIYEVFPYVTSATETGISRLGPGLLDSLSQPTLPTTLNQLLNACISAGHGL